MCSWGIAIPSTHVGLSIHSFIQWYLVKTIIVCVGGAAGYKDYALGVDGISWDPYFFCCLSVLLICPLWSALKPNSSCAISVCG